MLLLQPFLNYRKEQKCRQLKKLGVNFEGKYNSSTIVKGTLFFLPLMLTNLQNLINDANKLDLISPMKKKRNLKR